MRAPAIRRRLSGGVELLPGGAASARVWAPACRAVDVVFDHPSGRRIVAMEREDRGFFSATIDDVQAGERYWLRLDRDRLRPDPVSRYQPDGPHGPSMVVDPGAFRWTDAGWRGVDPRGQVLYEMHVGTFTPQGTWRAAAEQLPELARIGITVIEMMPVGDFAGRFGWGYDGVNLYAPTRLYGTPDDLRAFVDRAHGIGVAVILDVVYNHLGPDGNFLGEFSRDYVTAKYTNDWGEALNFEGPEPARQYFVENAGYWIDEFHFDGLRLDATQDIHDTSREHVIGSLVRRAREAAPGRQVYLVAENEPQETRLLKPAADGGYGCDAVWNDDYHHAALVALTGRREAYYMDYCGSPQEFVSAAKYGYLYQGQWYAWQKKSRGSAGLDIPAHAFVSFLENHDQVANTPFGLRVWQTTSPGRYRALTALTLLGPATPLLFQGQEFSASAPFLYFADHRDGLRESIRKGRREFLAQFPSAADAAVQAAIPFPDDERTFRRCVLDFAERERHAPSYRMHADLLALRRNDPVLASADAAIDGAVLSTHAFLLRFAVRGVGARVLIVNLGAMVDLSPLPEPLLAPPDGCEWEERWASESLEYGGAGREPLTDSPVLRLAAESAVFLAPRPAGQRDRSERR